MFPTLALLNHNLNSNPARQTFQLKSYNLLHISHTRTHTHLQKRKPSTSFITYSLSNFDEFFSEENCY